VKKSLSRPASPQFGELGTPYPLPPHFDDALRKRIEELLVRAVRPGRIANSAWTRLGQILGEYHFWASIVERRDVNQLETIAKRARTLEAAITSADRAGCAALVANALGAGKSGTKAKEVLILRLRELGSMAVGIPYPGRRQAELNLFAELADWWTRAGGKKTIRHDEEGKSYLVEFISLVLAALPTPRLRISAKTLERRLREADERTRHDHLKLAEMAMKLRKIQAIR
jgi:hypothetical protein